MSRKRFQFSLEKVLRLRSHETKRAELEHADALQRQRRQEEEVERLRSALQAAARSRSSAGCIRIHALQQAEAQREDSERRLRQSQAQLQNLEQTTERKRRMLADRRTAEESIENLREKQLEEHNAAAAATETAMLDEVAMAGFRRGTDT